MKAFPTVVAATLLLTACQSTTASVSRVDSAKTNQGTACSRVDATEYARISQRIAELEQKTAQGYRTTSTVVRVANPLRLCKGVVPFVSVCLPTPKPTSTLPSYDAYRAMKKELESLEVRKEALASCAG